MRALKLIVRTLSPVLATQAQSDEPNSSTSLGFIPGSMIRGALVERYRGEKSAENPQFRRLFLDGSVRFLNAYPAHGTDDARSLPRPLSWLAEKDKADDPAEPFYDFAVREKRFTGPAKSPPGDFFWRDGSSVQLRSVNRAIIVHNASDERNVRRKGTSQVFRYEAIASDERLTSFIISEDASLLEALKPLAGGQFSIGGSHTAGYGWVEVSIADDRIIEDWRESAEDESEYDDDSISDERITLVEAGRCTLTCLSDIALPPGVSNVNDWLASLVSAEPRASYYRLRIVGGFNRVWGLPLPQSWAIQAGSVFVFDQSHKSKLIERVNHGIGDRLVEGFGRVAVNLNALSELDRETWPERIRARGLRSETEADEPKLSAESRELARRMSQRVWIVEVERRLARRISELAGTLASTKFRNLPSPAQLSQARLAARRAWLAGDLDPIRQYVRDVRKSRPRQQEWDNARIGDSRLLDWIEQQTSGAASWRAEAGFAVAGQTPAWTDEDQCRMAARLVEGVMRRAVKVAKAQRDGERRQQ